MRLSLHFLNFNEFHAFLVLVEVQLSYAFSPKPKLPVLDLGGDGNGTAFAPSWAVCGCSGPAYNFKRGSIDWCRRLLRFNCPNIAFRNTSVGWVTNNRLAGFSLSPPGYPVWCLYNLFFHFVPEKCTYEERQQGRRKKEAEEENDGIVGRDKNIVRGKPRWSNFRSTSFPPSHPQSSV